ncbi:hypothetical protein AB0J84_12205 [Micromonospora arborensis]|uniref:hypothetical protein n=1 Tax=Micromonospora arborensis TaxID=2116518 RepID=UPI003436B203
MPARRNPKKSRRTPLGTDPATEHGLLPALTVGPALPALPALPVPALPAESTRPVDGPTSDMPVVVDVPSVDDALDVPAVVHVPTALDVPAVVDPSSTAGRLAAPKAGPPQAGGGRSGGGKSQRAGQPRRYAFRRS